MVLNTPIKDRLDQKLSTSELYFVKQALVTFLSETDPTVENTTMSNPLLTKLLPYLRAQSNTWDNLTPDDYNTSCNAIASVYHCLRGQFRTLHMLKAKVTEFLDEEEYVEQHSEEEIIPPEPKPRTRKETKKQEKLKSSDIKSQNSQTSAKKVIVAEAQPIQLPPLQIPIKSEAEAPTFECVQKMLFKCAFYGQYQEAAVEFKARKRDVKAAQKKLLEMQSKLTGLPNPFEDSE